MGTVWRIAYEIVGDGIAVAKEHERIVSEAKAECWRLARDLGALAFRPRHNGGIRTLLFEGKEPPEGYKYVGRPEANRVEASPRKNTRIGKEVAARIEAAPRWPDSQKLAGDLGWNPRDLPMDGYKIYWPTFYAFRLPTESWWLHVPRMADDGFEPGPMLAERPESALMLAMEAHNAAVRELGAKAA